MSFDPTPHLAGLKNFQLRAVEHVARQFYGERPLSGGRSGRLGRFLIADETGLGKSVVARGVIARAVEHLSVTDSSVASGNRSVTVLYVCSNQDLAQQNLQRLNITERSVFPTRLSLLAQNPQLTSDDTVNDVGVNLVSFTPGTSMDAGGRGSWRSGRANERALITLMLCRLTRANGQEQEAACQLMRGSSKLENFRREFNGLQHRHDDGDGLQADIVNRFYELVGSGTELSRFIAMRDDVMSRRGPTGAPNSNIWNLIRDLRRQLARAGAEALEPDLIILDEFQRFRHLLAEQGSPEDNEGAELARLLFEQDRARVLLLSATPYSPFTQSNSEEDHHRDFRNTISFLNRFDESADRRLGNALKEFRRALTQTGTEPRNAADRIRKVLLPVMSRSERPPLADQTDLVEVITQVSATPTAEDFSDWIILSKLGRMLGTRVSAEYWKSVPHFSTFMDDYQIGRRVKARIADGDQRVRTLLDLTTRITRAQVQAHYPIDVGNGLLRNLAEETVEAGWWKMLWLPPSMPYTKHGPLYHSLAKQRPTKRLIFSSWVSVPTSVSALLSYSADVEIIQQLRRALPTQQQDRVDATQFAGRLSWSTRGDGAPAAMNTFAIFCPDPGLAAAGDPLLREHRTIDVENLRDITEQAELSGLRLLESMSDAETVRELWQAVLSGGTPWTQAGTRWLRGVGGMGEEDNNGWQAHLDHATASASEDQRWHGDLGALASFSPGSIAYRCIERLAPDSEQWAVSRAAWTLSLGLRRLFNRGETARLLTALYGTPTRDKPYWRHVIDYCADGGLEAVLDEYLFQLASDSAATALDEKQLMEIANLALEGMSLLPSPYRGHDYTQKESSVTFLSRFALRFGDQRQSGEGDDSARRGQVRSSFNSPFAPFVLSTTSAGQEGIDFHWWCHRVIHWNLPSNPVDFEQREGRINRYAGHAVRKNVAHHHRDAVSGNQHPWRQVFAEAESASNRHGAFSPWWIYPGPNRIQRVVMTYPHSKDSIRYERLRDLLTSYRLTLGQPRQEDLLALMGTDSRELTIDLSPPDFASADSHN